MNTQWNLALQSNIILRVRQYSFATPCNLHRLHSAGVPTSLMDLVILYFGFGSSSAHRRLFSPELQTPSGSAAKVWDPPATCIPALILGWPHRQSKSASIAPTLDELATLRVTALLQGSTETRSFQYPVRLALTVRLHLGYTRRTSVSGLNQSSLVLGCNRGPVA